jgi:hypothetical protein
MLGVIDWGDAIAAPWAMVAYPLAVSTLPVAMDVPSNYHADGTPRDAEGIAQHKNREDYLRAVREAAFGSAKQRKNSRRRGSNEAV